MGDADPFPSVPKELQNNHVDVLYFTDRAPQEKKGSTNPYGYKRSRSVAFGVSRVEFGKNVSWEQLDKASRTSKRHINLDVSVKSTTELVKFSPTPRTLVPFPTTTKVSKGPTAQQYPFAMLGDDDNADTPETQEAVRREISARLAKTPVKEVYLFIHGYDNDFNDSVEMTAQLWHFLGRQGVPIAYSWPAGGKGLLRGYTYDRESGNFTIYHLKRVLRLIASCPDVKKINIIAHSRGTAVLVDALGELHLEIHGSGQKTRDVMKLGAIVMAAPDLSLDVVIQRCVTIRLGQVPERFAVYVCPNDKALAISGWLFGGLNRLGDIKPEIFTPGELAQLRKSDTIQLIEARVSDSGAFGHDYYHSNPAISSDWIMVMRYHLPPGAQYGRPLGLIGNGFWHINDKYPGKENIIPKTDSKE